MHPSKEYTTQVRLIEAARARRQELEREIVEEMRALEKVEKMKVKHGKTLDMYDSLLSNKTATPPPPPAEASAEFSADEEALFSADDEAQSSQEAQSSADEEAESSADEGAESSAEGASSSDEGASSSADEGAEFSADEGAESSADEEAESSEPLTTDINADAAHETALALACVACKAQAALEAVQIGKWNRAQKFVVEMLEAGTRLRDMLDAVRVNEVLSGKGY
ncbi:unnamed protein product [Zymoseptoria tritici ST99CH_1A5]|uniref:Uncharacterized protein n=2 Tax=Zymoseptoria tritici TaxID=1047171 RepID=A0A1X7S9W0_ZYMT9|nr:unnamed protein product [Zymoseptoria tritici ST99CH_3D7]SMR64903.1 unnamed protein product [Zymoseptoria tritici ST99CH_3D1]SMY30292.1 unnamed protein product [Zymoseptoria tritici ST99CH_1A5]